MDQQYYYSGPQRNGQNVQTPNHNDYQLNVSYKQFESNQYLERQKKLSYAQELQLQIAEKERT